MRTRRGIYYDLTMSPYKYNSIDTGIKYVFSSDLHLTKFEDRYKEHRLSFNTTLKARLRININFNLLADLVLYKKIESRGFLVINEEGQKLCLENLILSGEKVMKKNSIP